MTTARQRRLDRKFKNHLRCEWCNRWGLVHYETWRETIRQLRDNHREYIFFCSRQRCIDSRVSGLLSGLTESQRKQLVTDD